MTEFRIDEYKIITGILRQKIKEQANYIAELEKKLETPGIKEKQLKQKIAGLVKKAKNNSKKGKKNV